jgi:pimeloyl-ACP methyl ester carboxylesterase
VRGVIFLPGIIAPAAVRYAPLISHLPDVNAVTKDLEVYLGETTPPPNYSIDLEVAGTDRAADAAGFDQFHVYGHSGGGAIALAYAAAHPERLLSLAVDEPAYDFTEEVRADYEEFGPLVALPVPERMAAFVRLQVAVDVTLPPPPDGPPPPFMASRPAGIEAFLAATSDHPRLDSRYRAFTSPVLYTWGELTHPRWYVMKDRLAGLFPDFTSKRFDGIHHMNTSHQAEPERTATLLNEFWTRAEASS